MIGCGSLLITPATLPWLSSVKSLYLHAESTEPSLIESDSACLLQHLKIWNFQTMISIPRMFLNTACLQNLDLYSLPSLTTFPADGLPTSLQSLRISNGQNLAFLPPETWCSYTSLVTLVLVYSCDALTSFSLNGFPVLQSLSIEGCMNLQCFFISDIASHCQSSLKSLTVSYCDALRSLPQQMNTLTALESLSLDSLSSFCEGACLPPKLRIIYIEDCRRLELLPKDGLPSLKILKIGRCRMLKLRYGIRRGEHWSNIAHIPVIEVNDELTI